MTTHQILVDLRRSGLPDDYIARMGCTPIDREQVSRITGRPTDSIDPDGGYTIPYRDERTHAGEEYFRIRLAEGKPKYLGPQGNENRVYKPIDYGHHGQREMLLIVEGEKKAAAADSLRLDALGIAGVTSWADEGSRAVERKNGEGMSGDTLPLKTLLDESLKHHTIIIVGDSDAYSNPAVMGGLAKLQAALQKHLDAATDDLISKPDFDPIDGCRTITVMLAIISPDFAGEAKVGFDDYLMAFKEGGKFDNETEQQFHSRAGVRLRDLVLALGLSSVCDTDEGIARVVAARNQQRLCYHAGSFKTYRPVSGIWADTVADDEFGIPASVDGLLNMAAQKMNSSLAEVMLPFRFMNEGEVPSNVKQWRKRFEKRIASLVAAKKQLKMTKGAMNILKQVERMLFIPDKRWDRHSGLFCAANCVIDLQTGKTQPHSPSLLLTKHSSVIYDPLASCPLWEDFLAKVLPDKDVANYYQALVGYQLTGSTEVQQIYFHRGVGGNGKGVANEVLMRVFDDYVVIGSKTLVAKSKNGSESHPTVLAALAGARWVNISELDDLTHLDCGAIKNYTGGGKQTARRIGKDFFDFWPTWTITCDTNDIPYVKETSPAMRRRLILIEWNYKACPELTVNFESDPEAVKPDKKLAEKIIATEASGVLNWAIDGTRRFYDGALDFDRIPHAVRVATALLWQQLDTTGQWLKEECALDGQAHTNKKILFNSYTAWNKENGFPNSTSNAFTRRMRQAGFSFRESNGQGIYAGLRLRTEVEKKALYSDSPDALAIEAPPVETKPPRKPAGSVPVTDGKSKRRFVQ
jgi:P4 family phage/plasmid primase-like protien